MNHIINYYVKIKINTGKDVKKLTIGCQNSFSLGFVNITPLLSIRQIMHPQSYPLFLSIYCANNGK